MLISERKLRIYGHLVFAIIFYVFFMLEMFFSLRADNLLPKTILVTFLFTITIWEPTRLVILWTRKKWGGLKNLRKRLLIDALVLVPYACLLGIIRTLLEHYTKIWWMPVVLVTVYFYFIGLSFLFIVLQVAVYEGLYSIEEWHKSSLEARELKKLNLQMQFDSLKVQIQPHFLFNTLNTLVGLIDIDKIRAVKFTRQLAFVYRYLLNAHDQPLIDLDEELKFTRAYFFLLKTRYSEGLHLDIAWDKETDKFRVPPLSLQILLENAVKHNVITQARPLRIKIEIDSQSRQVKVINNLQKKNDVMSNEKGLTHLKKKFELLNLGDIVISANFWDFTVIVPIVEVAEEDK